MSDIEQYPHVMKKIVDFWFTSECSTVLQTLCLVETTRDNREGFPFDVMSDLIMLQALHEQHFPPPEKRGF